MRPICFGTLARIEWRAFAATPLPWLVVALAIFLESVAVGNSIVDIGDRRHAFEQAIVEQEAIYSGARKAIADIEARRLAKGVPLTRLRNGIPSPASVQGHLASFKAALPPLPTALLSSGTTDVLPQRYAYRTGERFSPFIRTAGTRILGGLFPERQTENPASQLSGRFDLGFVSLYLVPVLILALTYNVVSADREAGVLALVLAQPVSFGRWLTARMTVRAGFAFCFAVLLPAIAALAMMGSAASPDSLMRLGIWLIAAIAYSAFWLLLGLLTSVRATSAAKSAVIAISAWLILIILLPALTSLALSASAPTTSALAYADAERAASLAVNPRIDRAVGALNLLVKARFGSIPVGDDRDDPSFTESVELREAAELLTVLATVESRWSRAMPPAQLTRALAEARRVLMERELQSVVREIHAQEMEMESRTAILRFCSPALLFQAVTEAAAGTDAARWNQLLDQLDAYVRKRDEFLTEKILAKQNVHSKDFEHLRVFAFREEGPTALLRRIGWYLAGLFGMCMLAGVALLKRSANS